MSVLKGGSSFYLSPSTYQYLCGKTVNEIVVSVSEVSDSVAEFLTKVCCTKTHASHDDDLV